MSRVDDVERIRVALRAAADALAPYTSGDVGFVVKERGDPLTQADLAADAALRATLPRGDEAWLSEESGAAGGRLGARRIWIVDPIDGTREFVDGVPEWCISIGLVEDGQPVAGGVLNPASGEEIVGSLDGGIIYEGTRAAIGTGTNGQRLTVLASRSETGRREWERYGDAPFDIRPCGSVAFKMGLVAAGRADATWTLRPKSEWDVAAGTALVRAAGGHASLADGREPQFNKTEPIFPHFAATRSAEMWDSIRPWLEER